MKKGRAGACRARGGKEVKSDKVVVAADVVVCVVAACVVVVCVVVACVVVVVVVVAVVCFCWGEVCCRGVVWPRNTS